MSVDRKTVAKIAHLARISVPEERLDGMTDELNNILGWVEQLGEVNVEGVAAMTSAVETELYRRDDVVNDGEKSADVLANAPHEEYGFFAVPKVLE